MPVLHSNDTATNEPDALPHHESRLMQNSLECKRPLILVAPRWEEGHIVGCETLSPNESIATVFMDAILAAGGLPMLMSLTDDDADVNPKRWGVADPYDPTLCCEIRDCFEFRLVREVLAQKKPLFTTCRGMQLLNVATGGTLCMDVPGMKPCQGMAQWRHAHSLTEPCHPVEVEPGSLLCRALEGRTLIQTNSAHHCCVEKVGSHTHLVAHATDGMPEAIEVEDQPFCVGVQWHPEYTWHTIESDFKLWQAFVAAAAGKSI